MRTPEEVALSIGRRSTIKNPSSDAFKKSGAAAARVIRDALETLVDLDDSHVLDFGCGSGRVLLPLSRSLLRTRFTGTDVDAEAIEYLRLTAPSNVEAIVNPYEGRLPHEDGTLDAVYAISVWSHFPESLSDQWLSEVGRVLRDGGAAIITVGGRNTLEHWRETHVRWREVTLEDYEREGYVYREFVNLTSSPDYYPGITESWGNALVHPDYIRRRWGRAFEVLSVEPGGMNGNQDLVLLRRPFRSKRARR